MFTPKDITVFITCYKEGDLIYKAINSLEKQSIKGFEILIINDCSPDDITNKICKELEDSKMYQVHFRATNGGLSAARNTAFSLMKGKIAMPLDADDTLPLNAVEDTLNMFNKNPDAEMIFGNYYIINPDTGEKKHRDCSTIANANGELDYVKLSKDWILMGQSPCKKDLWERIGGYYLEFSNTVQDVDFWRRACLNDVKGYYVDATIYNWFRSESGMNSSVKEEDYLKLRIASMPFYDKYNPEYGEKMRQYIYRYYSSHLKAKELNNFVKKNKKHFTKSQQLKAKAMYLKLLYKIGRQINNAFK